jgi:hypothetical protein
MSALEVIDRHIKEAEDKAAVNFQRQKWMMFGYWKAIAVHLRKVRRELKHGNDSV